MVPIIVFVVAAAICVAGALGVVLNRNPVHSALSLVATLFGVAVLFIAQDAQFLAAVQVIVYAGAIVVLFLFVIMLLGVDRAENLESEPLTGQRPAALVAGLLIGGGLIAVLVASTITGKHSSGAKVDPAQANVNQIGRLLFTDHLWAFEITSVLLVIAVVGAVVLARRGAPGSGADAVDAGIPADDFGEPASPDTVPPNDVEETVR
ncbi:MAG: NADH:ubiquinone oxidoreductase subunit 6 [Acidimicrobiales bacterium]|nr:NADH:ubiquinone oxidoreductase subunit 6 [Acidimicrobiales bacterium]